LAPKARKLTLARRTMKRFFGLVGISMSDDVDHHRGREETCAVRHEVCLPKEIRFLVVFDVNARGKRPGSGADHLFIRSGN
jgi:hypothetical protein